MEGVFTEEAREMGIPVTIIPQEKDGIYLYSVKLRNL